MRVSIDHRHGSLLPVHFTVSQSLVPWATLLGRRPPRCQERSRFRNGSDRFLPIASRRLPIYSTISHLNIREKRCSSFAPHAFLFQPLERSEAIERLERFELLLVARTRSTITKMRIASRLDRK